MRNYKPFVVCVLLPIVILAMCQAESHSARLTAFGKAPSDNKPTSPKKHTLGRTRECKEDTDCAGIQNTTCMSDPRDSKRRCLCRDSSAPMNGACPNLPRAVKSSCTADSECIHNAECRVPPNATTLSKICVCLENFKEDTYGGCNSACRLFTSQAALALLGVVTLLIFLPTKRLLGV